MKVLYVSTEVYPALKTGGLADVNGALPAAMNALGADVRLLLPAFPALLSAVQFPRRIATLALTLGLGADGFNAPARPAQVDAVETLQLLRGVLNGVTTYLIVAPAYYDRPGNPYIDANGIDWPDNPLRFALLGSVAARFADGSFDAWRPDIIHSHDWHAGLAPAYVAARGGDRPGTVFTVHNLSYQGQFPAKTFAALHLPAHFFAVDGLEFYGGVNFMKAGLFYADRITTVSPTYAGEIQMPEQGAGMDGLLRSRAGALSGILNGVDPQEWNPAIDRRIPATYEIGRMEGKGECRRTLQAEFGLSPSAKGPLVGVVSRLTMQKGLDLLLGALSQLIDAGGQLALVGTGDPAIEQGFVVAAEAHPGAVGVRIGYDEGLAHRIVAGADVIAVPSRFEPCGLTQMYGLAYGTLPLVRGVGGLADTVTDASQAGGNGFVFVPASIEAIRSAVERIAATWRDRAAWTALQDNAMRADFSWTPSARQYLELYRSLRPNARD